MDLLTILRIVSIVLGILTGTLIPTGIALYNAIKKRRAAETKAEKEAATNDMLNQLNILIESMESTYKDIDAVMKERGSSMGPVKKDGVLTKLQAYAISKGYEFDADFWSAKNDEVVKLTKAVNAKEIVE